jgi:hypothetical protein
LGGRRGHAERKKDDRARESRPTLKPRQDTGDGPARPSPRPSLRASPSSNPTPCPESGKQPPWAGARPPVSFLRN